MANDKYILSNDYYVEIETNGIQNWAILYDPFGFKVNEGPKTLSDALLNLVKQVINDYTPIGRKNDTSNWINVPTVVREEVAPKPVTFKVQGSVSDKNTGEPIQGAKLVLGSNKVSSNSRGSYEFSITLKTDEQPPSSITVTKSGYAPISNIPATRQDGSLKSKINVISMDSLKKSLEKEEANVKVLEEGTVNKVKKLDIKSIEAKVIDTVNKEVNNLLERAVPFALSILVGFGISKLSEAANKSCPTLPNISGAINNKNKLTRQLNNSFKTIKSVSSAGQILTTLITVAKIISKLFKKNPIPSTIGTPPGPAGGVIVSTSLGKITSIDEKREKVDKLIEKLDNIGKALVPAVIPLVDTIGKLISLLSTIDGFIGECLNDIRQSVLDELNKKSEGDITGAISQSNGGNGQDANGGIGVGVGPNVGIGVGSNGNNISGGGLNTSDASKAGINTIDNFDFTTVSDSELKNILGLDPNSNINVQDLLAGNYLQEQLDKELTGLTNESANDGQPSITEYNGFIISVETESESAAAGKSIKRRFAVGKNRDGVLLVQGEKSYSSNDQLLIDELIFKIESEDLKSV